MKGVLDSKALETPGMTGSVSQESFKDINRCPIVATIELNSAGIIFRKVKIEIAIICFMEDIFKIMSMSFPKYSILDFRRHVIVALINTLSLHMLWPQAFLCWLTTI